MSVRRSGRGPAAFSLVEVALAVGILSFALVAIMGLLSVGINASRDSGDDTKVGFIMQDVANRVRAEVASVNVATDPTKLDLTWNTAYNSTSLDYKILGATTLPNDPATGQPQAAATAYYTQDGQFVKQAGAVAPTQNFYKASVFIQPLAAYPFPTPTPSSGDSQYPFLAVTIKVGWPTDTAVNGNVLGTASPFKTVCTFYLLKP